MQIDPHDLHHDFPEFNDKIHKLKTEDAHFAKLFNEYDGLDHEIHRLEKAGLPISDSDMEVQKLRRIHLKDQLYAYLTKAD